MKVESTRFGTLDVSEDRVITFPEGFPGFVGKRWVLVDEPKQPLAWWLQSAEQAPVAVLVVDPKLLPMPYTTSPKPGDVRAISGGDAGAPEALTCRIVVRSGDRPGELFFNLFAPVFVNAARRLAIQVPLVGSGFSVREPWPPRPDAEKTEPE